MAIVTASKKGTVIVIDPDEDKAREVRETLERSMEKIAVINTKRLAPRFGEINRLMGDSTYWKKKGFEVFPPTISRREESYGQEL